MDLEVIKRSGTPQEVWLAERVEPVRVPVVIGLLSGPQMAAVNL